MRQNALLMYAHLRVNFNAQQGVVHAVKDLPFHVDSRETLAIVGESGSGKSVASLAFMRLVHYGDGQIKKGEMWLQQGLNHHSLLSTPQKC